APSSCTTSATSRSMPAWDLPRASRRSPISCRTRSSRPPSARKPHALARRAPHPAPRRLQLRHTLSALSGSVNDMAADLASLRLETARLILRPPRLEDFDAWAEFQDDEIATRYIGGRQVRATAWRTFMGMCGCWHMTGIAMFSVIEKSSGSWVGRLGPWFPEGWPAPEVGWGIARPHWGKGYA